MKHKLLSILLCLAMALSLLPTAALAEETGTPENYVTLELTYGSSVTEESIAAAKAMYEGITYDTCKAANEAFMALYGVSWCNREGGNPYLNVTDNTAPLRAYATNADAVTEVKYYIHGTLAGFTSLLSDGNQIDCTVGGNHQIPRTSISIIGVDGSDGKAKLTDGNVQAYVAGGYDNMFRSSGTLTIQNIEFANVGTTIIAASSAIDTSTNKTVNSAKMIIENCKFDGTLSMYSNFLNNGVMDYTIRNCEFDGTNATGNFAIWPQNTNATAELNYGPAKLTISDNKISGYQRGINIDNASTDVVIEKNTIIPGKGYSAVQLSRTKNAQIKSNDIVLNGGNVITLYEKLLEMSTAPEVSIENNTITGTGYLIYDDAAANNKSFTSDKLKLTYSSNTVPSTVDTTKGVKGSKTTALTGYVAAVAQGKDDITGKVAQVGTEYYTTLTEAFAALDGTNHTLTLIDGSKWTYKDVYWSAGNQVGSEDTLKAAMEAAYAKNAGSITIICKPNATITTSPAHINVTGDITVYANGADFGGNDLSIGTYAAPENSTTTINIYDAKNLVVWGQPVGERPDVWNVNFTDCVNNGSNFLMYRADTGKATINATLTGCKATGFVDSIIHTTADGRITIKNCEFANNCAPVNIAHKQAGEMTVTVENSTFTNCGSTSTENKLNQYAAPVRIVNNNAAGTVATEVTNCTFADTVGNNGDILIGDGRDGKESKDVSLTVKNTAADVQAQKPGYYNPDGAVAEAGNVSKTTIPASETPTTIKLESNKDFKLAEVNGAQMSSLTDALDYARSSNKPIKLLSADTALVQAILDGQYGSIDGLTIELPTGNYGQLELGRATKYAGSNTRYFAGLNEDGSGAIEYSYADFITLKNNGQWSPTPRYIRSMKNVTLKAADGAMVNVAGIFASSGHKHENAYDYVLDRDVANGTNTYYLVFDFANITFDGLTFTAKSDINTSLEQSNIDRFTFKNCTFNINNMADGNQAIRYYNENDNGKVSNLVVDNCKFNNCYQGVYTSHIKNIFVTNSEFDTTRHNAIAIQDFNGACDHGKVIITGNTFKNIGDRIIRFNNVGAGTQITITHNTATNSGDDNGEVIKASSIADGVTTTVRENSWGAGTTVANNQFKDTAAPSYSGGSSSYDPTYSVSTPSKTKNGTVTVSPKSASKGDTVTVTVKPDSGYVLETLTVTDKNGNELTLKDKGNGKYTFTMPAGKVEVKATFMEDNSMLNFFYDVPNNAYFYEAVKWAVKNGITTGVGNDLFAPEQPCTRAQIVTFLWRAAGSPEPKAASSFADVAAGSYYAKAVAWAVENGITTGTGDGKFSPDATCTRAQAVTFLARALNAKAVSAAEFSDVPTDSYFADAVAWAAANGVTEGIGGGLFGPDNDCTRAQIVTFLFRAYQGK